MAVNKSGDDWDQAELFCCNKSDDDWDRAELNVGEAESESADEDHSPQALAFQAVAPEHEESTQEDNEDSSKKKRKMSPEEKQQIEDQIVPEGGEDHMAPTGQGDQKLAPEEEQRTFKRPGSQSSHG